MLNQIQHDETARRRCWKSWTWFRISMTC